MNTVEKILNTLSDKGYKNITKDIEKMQQDQFYAKKVLFRIPEVKKTTKLSSVLLDMFLFHKTDLGCKYYLSVIDELREISI